MCIRRSRTASGRTGLLRPDNVGRLLALHRLRVDYRLGLLHRLRPLERGRRRRVIAGQVARQACGGLGVGWRVVAKHFAAQRGERGIVCDKLRPRMDVIVVEIVEAVVPYQAATQTAKYS